MLWVMSFSGFVDLSGGSQVQYMLKLMERKLVLFIDDGIYGEEFMIYTWGKLYF
jgi:hypothetical protein